jgi:methionyl-tRNA formyltransferase
MSRLVWLGSPPASAQCLQEVHAAGHEIVLVVTEPDRRRGRGATLQPTPVKALALQLGLEVTETLQEIPRTAAELGVVVAFGRLIPSRVLELLPMVNLHFSLLPRWRGAAPVERAILAGDSYTGVCVMQVEPGLDTGGVYSSVSTPIGEEESATELTDRLAGLGARLLVDTLSLGVQALSTPCPQQGEPTYAHKLTAADRYLDFSRSACELQRTVRVGRAWTTWRSRRLLVLSAGTAPDSELVRAESAGDTDRRESLTGRLRDEAIVCGSGMLVPRLVQLEGRRPQAFSEWIRGSRLASDDRFGEGAPAFQSRAQVP